MNEMATTVMTREEAETTNDLIKHYVNNARLLLLEDMRSVRASMGRKAFSDWLQKKYELSDFQAAVFTRLVDKPRGKQGIGIPLEDSVLDAVLDQYSLRSEG